jgi:DNA-binding NtrC family response regulator
MTTVLVVEDEFQVLMLAESVLQCAGYETVSAANVADAEAILHSDQDIDLVFTDIGLNNQSEGGVAVGKMAEESRDGVPVLYTSGQPTEDVRSLFVSKSKFLPKPYTEHQLKQAVASLLPAKE